MRITTKNEKETQKLAEKIAKDLRGGEVLALVGDLGAGKTTFTQGLAKALGVKTRVNSPTFVVMKLYKPKHPTIKNLAHIDAYRLGDEIDLKQIGWDDFQDKQSVVVIEWADKAKNILPKQTVWLKFVLLKNGSRAITITNFPKQPNPKTKNN
jgi:tRNA threonylcarbamoyladenosine biosynthesis protein TsaE